MEIRAEHIRLEVGKIYQILRKGFHSLSLQLSKFIQSSNNPLELRSAIVLKFHEWLDLSSFQIYMNFLFFLIFNLRIWLRRRGIYTGIELLEDLFCLYLPIFHIFFWSERINMKIEMLKNSFIIFNPSVKSSMILQWFSITIIFQVPPHTRIW